ncbi:F-box protein PP2-B1 [Zostera marina]|uniref:F-box protein PP2-B1 n=1 Tax=Zostera marina TaxID=29655 RepID=A0A0K9PSJ2_ZOSMR|nr:F-box protein PP2-B1 [Zostera marina]
MELGRIRDVKLDDLPEECISHILSLTTPKDVCVCAAVSTVFHSATESDSVWNQFLPSDYQNILSRAVDHVHFSSKKDLFFQLCRPLLVDESKVSFMLEKSTGYKCFMLSAEKLYIVWGDTPEYWIWHPLPQSRFSKVAELVNVCWFSVSGTVRSGDLQANTNYTAYLIYKFSPGSYGFRKDHHETRVKIAGEVICDEILYLLQPTPPPPTTTTTSMLTIGNLNWRQESFSRLEEVKYFPKERDDDWMEIELGEFLNGEEEEEIKIHLRETESGCWKRGIIIEGIEFKPTKL